MHSRDSVKQWLRVAGAMLALSVTSLPSHANSPFEATTIRALSIHDSNLYVLIEVQAKVGGAENCPSTTLVLDKNWPSYKEMYTAALTATATGQPIRGWVNGCTQIYSSPMMPKLTVLTLLAN